MLYDLGNHLDRERFKRRCNALFQKRCVAELSERTMRTTRQNAYLHLLLGYLATETGNTLGYVKEVFYKRAANRDIYVCEKDDPILGKVEYLRSSSDLTKEEMMTSIDRFRDWSSQTAGIYLPAANEQEFLAAIEIEMNRMKQWI